MVELSAFVTTRRKSLRESERVRCSDLIYYYWGGKALNRFDRDYDSAYSDLNEVSTSSARSNNSGKLRQGDYERKLEIIEITRGMERLARVCTIILKVDSTGRATMDDLDTALRAVHIQAAVYRIYWQQSQRHVFPVFNYITLSAVLHLMAKSNNRLFLVKQLVDNKRSKRMFSTDCSAYLVDPNDEKIILRMAPPMDVYTKIEESSAANLHNAGRSEHCPVSSDKQSLASTPHSSPKKKVTPK